MVDAATKVPVKAEAKPASAAGAPQAWHPFEALRREVDRLFQDFGRGLGRSPFRRSPFSLEPFWQRESNAPAVDVVETDKDYEIRADLPGIDEKDIEVQLANGNLTIRGEKKQEKEEKKEDYYLSERQFGFFQRIFTVPAGVDTDKIEADFKKGVLTITLPKKPEAQQPAKKIDVKAA